MGLLARHHLVEMVGALQNDLGRNAFLRPTDVDTGTPPEGFALGAADYLPRVRIGVGPRDDFGKPLAIGANVGLMSATARY